MDVVSETVPLDEAVIATRTGTRALEAALLAPGRACPHPANRGHFRPSKWYLACLWSFAPLLDHSDTKEKRLAVSQASHRHAPATDAQPGLNDLETMARSRRPRQGRDRHAGRSQAPGSSSSFGPAAQSPSVRPPSSAMTLNTPMPVTQSPFSSWCQPWSTSPRRAASTSFRAS